VLLGVQDRVGRFGVISWLAGVKKLSTGGFGVLVSVATTMVDEEQEAVSVSILGRLVQLRPSGPFCAAEVFWVQRILRMV
jgi:hypothetical protein